MWPSPAPLVLDVRKSTLPLLYEPLRVIEESSYNDEDDRVIPINWEFLHVALGSRQLSSSLCCNPGQWVQPHAGAVHWIKETGSFWFQGFPAKAKETGIIILLIVDIKSKILYLFLKPCPLSRSVVTSFKSNYNHHYQCNQYLVICTCVVFWYHCKLIVINTSKIAKRLSNCWVDSQLTWRFQEMKM